MGGNLLLKIAAGCLTLTLIGGLSAVVCSATDLSEYEQRQKELDKQAQQYQAILDSTQSGIEQKEEYKEALINKITVLNEQIANGRSELASLDTEITELQAEVDSARSGISDRMDALKQRLRAIYLSGETTSIEIILGAKDFEDFLDKVELVAYISNSDKKMIDQLKSEIDVINKKKSELDAKKTTLSDEQKKLDNRQKELERLIAENQSSLDSLYADNAAAQDHLDENDAERQKIEDAIKAYYADQAAQAEAARIASEAEASLAASRDAYNSKNNASSNYVSVTSGYLTNHDDTVSKYESADDTPSNTVTSEENFYQEPRSSEQESSKPVYYPEPEPEPEPEPISSGYVWPVPGHYVLSSQWNEDRNTYNHGAIDISDGSIMNAEVVAAESGTVVLSNNDCVHNYAKDGSCGCGGGYGNYLMIDHGNGKATLYAHMTTLTVSSGTYVRKGEVIGYVGTTGWSTGPHLHFECRLNGEKYNPMIEYPYL